MVEKAPQDVAVKARFLAASGLRIDELAHLEPGDVDLERGWLHVRTKVTHDGTKWTPKDDEDRKIALNDELRAVLCKLLPAGGSASRGYLFPSRPGRWRAKNFARTTLGQFKRLSEPTGIPKKKLTSHNFRRYFVSQCADCGIDVLCVMEWVGHSDWQMVRRYYRLRDDHAQASMRKFTTGTPGGAERPTTTAPGNSGEHVGNKRDGEKRNGRRRDSQRSAQQRVTKRGAKRKAS